jgi:DNA polymerase-1
MVNRLAFMEMLGVKLDQRLLAELSSDFKKHLGELEGKIWKLAGREFNIGSPKQLGEVLFVDMSIAGGKKSKTGAYSTGAEVLETLSEQGFEIADLVLQWRQFSKLLSTYTEALPKAIDPETGRVHTNFMMTVTSTGRLSSTEPNLQNIPIRTEEGHRIREAFIAEEGNTLISADYSQIELRLLAHIAGIKQLQDAFMHNQDIHAITASEVFGVPVDQVDSTLRRQAKTINFGIIYGISAFGLARRLDIPREVAQKYIDTYFKQYPGIKEYMARSIDFARKYGFIPTLFGRRCYINGINDQNFSVRGFAERAAINAPLQGTAADLIKLAMARMPEAIARYMTLQIHDELLFEVPEDIVDKAIPTIRKTMESVIQLSVPVTVDVRKGKTWATAH